MTTWIVVLVTLSICLFIVASPWLNQHVADEQDKVVVMNVSNQHLKRLDIVCCGFGDRVKELVQHASPYHTLVVNMGRCGPNITNIWNHFFPSMPTYEGQPNTCDVKPNPGVPSAGRWLAGLNESDEMIVKCKKEHYNHKYGRIMTQDYRRVIRDKNAEGLISELYSSLNPSMRQRMSEIIGMNETDVVTWHIRYGNMRTESDYKYDRDYARKNRNDVYGNQEALLLTLNRTLHEITRIARNPRKIVVVGDTPWVLQMVETLGFDGIVTTYKTQNYRRAGHPMVFNKMRYNNGGSRCDIKMLEGTLVDMMVLGYGRILFASNPSSFLILPAMKVIQDGGRFYMWSGKKFIEY